MAARSRPGRRRLIGRDAECEALDHLLNDVLGGHSRVVLLQGEAGVGKSALLSHLSERLAGWRIAKTVGVESEMELAYSGLHQLCGPMMDLLDRLPPPQRDALATVIGLSSGPAPDGFLVGLATLTMFAEAAEGQPLACIVDDAQWVDRASTRVLGFVGRRLLAERVALVLAGRPGGSDAVLAGLPRMPIGGLPRSDARTLLLENVHGPVDTAVVDQIVAESHGNPLALLELPRTRDIAALAGGFGLPDSDPVVSRIEESLVARLRRLPADTRLLVLAAAAEPVGDALLLYRTAHELGIDMSATAPAEDAGLLRLRGRVEFAHPLIRSATYRAASVTDRRRVHRALAVATDARADPDRRAWHRAAGADGPDEEVAAELVSSAARAQLRGGLAAAAAFLTRATELTPVATTRVQRALDAAHGNLQAGAFEAARDLLALADEGPATELQRASIELLRAQLAFAASRGTTATPLLLAAARRLEPLDIELARETYLDAFSAALFGARLNGAPGVAEVAHAARGLLRPPADGGDPPAAVLLLDALVALHDEDDTAVARCREALQKLSTGAITANERLRWLWQGCVVALEIWDDESAYTLSRHNVDVARRTGTLTELALALSAGTAVLVLCGELSAAESAVAETQSVQEATGIRSAPYGALMLGAWRGDERGTRELIDRTSREAGARGEGIGLAIAQYARAVLCNGRGRFEEALDAARSAAVHREVVAENWGLSELVEPAVRTGRTHLASEALGRLALKAAASGSHWALGIEARSRALLSEDDQAESWFHCAIAHLREARVPGELARAHLLHGELLRRLNRPGDARSELTSAYEMFSAMGMEGFSERCRQELLATGATVHPLAVDSRHHLSAQEAQIARLARDGLSNPEIGAQLLVSSRTVEWHLRKVYGKLGIGSRRELRTALPEDRWPGQAP